MQTYRLPIDNILSTYFFDFSYEEALPMIRMDYISYKYKKLIYYSDLKSELEETLRLNPTDTEDIIRIRSLVHGSAGKPLENVTLQKQWLQKLYDDLFGYIESLSDEELETKYYEYNPKKKSTYIETENAAP